MSAVREAAAADYIAYFARTRAGHLACVDLESGRSLTYRALDTRVWRVAAMLERMVGADRIAGARIASLARNSTDLVCLYLACARVGAIYAPLNWRLSGAELAGVVRDVEPTLLCLDAEFETNAATLTAAYPDMRVLRLGDAFEAAVEMAAERPNGAYALHMDDVTTLLSTSGTTGRPKSVMVTARNAEATASNYAFSAGVGVNSVFLCDMPMFHVVGLFAVARTALQYGGTLLVSSRFDAAQTLRRIADPELGVSHYFCAPQMMQMMREAPNFDPAPFRKLTALQSGGAPHATAAVMQWLNDGVRMVDGFGMSEAGTILGMPPADIDLLKRKAGAAGLPALHVDIRLVDAEGRDVAVGEVGEIWLRGPSISPGYWRNEGATSAAFKDGWLKSGDAAKQDEDGFYTIVDRWKDMYVTGGENVYPAEVEAVLHGAEGVAEAAIIGVPDERWGETGAAFVVRAPGATLRAEDVITLCRQSLAPYKAPKHVVFVDALPRTASGKLLKRDLRRAWIDSAGV